KLAVFPKLKPSTEAISLSMPENLLDTIRSHAQRLDVPYQSLIKLWIAEKVATLARQQKAARSRGK
ncbi:MAG: CopG family antitoxin, partial [Terracidiphilus sp.]